MTEQEKDETLDVAINDVKRLEEELRKVRNELAMTKQDLQKAQMAVATAVKFLHSIGGNLVKVSLAQSEAQGLNAETIKGIEKILAIVQPQPQQQQQQQTQTIATAVCTKCGRIQTDPKYNNPQAQNAMTNFINGCDSCTKIGA